jgi:hypothetical protein
LLNLMPTKIETWEEQGIVRSTIRASPKSVANLYGQNLYPPKLPKFVRSTYMNFKRPPYITTTSSPFHNLSTYLPTYLPIFVWHQ